jgi:hypothetical protein
MVDHCCEIPLIWHELVVAPRGQVGSYRAAVPPLPSAFVGEELGLPDFAPFAAFGERFFNDGEVVGSEVVASFVGPG